MSEEKVRSLPEIDKEIEALFKERAKALAIADRQFVEVYTVFNNQTGHIDDNTFVLNPLNKRDLEFLEVYIEGMKEGVFKLNLQDWLKEYSTFKCFKRNGVCPHTGTPVCCAHCSKLQECIASASFDYGLCPSVEVGEVLVISDCIDED